MGRRWASVLLAVVGITLFAAPAAHAAGEHRLGLGANYWKTVKDLDTDFDKNGLSWLASYQYAPVGLFKLELDAEVFPKDFGGSTGTVWAPEAFVLVGGTIYAGVGAGIYHSDDGWADSPFYVLRAGLDFELVPLIHLDLNANYRFNDWDGLKGSDLKTDTIRLGAAVRIAL
jgi:hypothetical protein